MEDQSSNIDRCVRQTRWMASRPRPIHDDAAAASSLTGCRLETVQAVERHLERVYHL
jgi:hypothetical protein